MSANLGNSAVATGLEKVSSHFNPKEGQYQRLFKLPYNCVHFTYWQGNAQNPSSKASAVCGPRTSYKLSFDEAEEPEIKLPKFVGSWRKQESFRKSSTSLSLTTLKPLTVWITTNCGEFFKRWEYQTIYLPAEKPVCRSRSNRSGHGTMDWFHIGKGVC